MSTATISDNLNFTGAEIQFIRDLEDGLLDNIPRLVAVLEVGIELCKREREPMGYLKLNAIREKLLSKEYTNHINNFGRISDKMEQINKSFKK